MVLSLFVLYFLGITHSFECSIGSLSPLYSIQTDYDAHPRDIRLRPGASDDELWVALEENDSMLILTLDADANVAQAEEKHDLLGYHYMDQVSSIAFKEDGEWFATCQESNNNYNNPASTGNGFMGPSLWKTADYAQVNQDNGMWATVNGQAAYGSHYDMLHEAPFCVGIEWWEDNRYFAVDGSGLFNNNNLVMFDFMEDHGPGGSDHSVAVVWRIKDAAFSRVDRVSSHMRMSNNGWLYIADTGNNRVVRFEVGSGQEGNQVPYSKWVENLGAYVYYAGGNFEDIVESFTRPSALTMVGDSHFLVGSHETGALSMYTLEGDLVHTWEDFNAYGLQSVLVHNNMIYAINRDSNDVMAAYFLCDDNSEPETPTDIDEGDDSHNVGVDCSTFTKKNKCNNKSDDACEWNLETEICEVAGAVSMCDDVPKKDCKNMEGLCVWDTPYKECMEPPAEWCWYPTENKCNKAGYCQWNEETCEQLECSEIAKKKHCKTLNDICKWNKSNGECRDRS